MQCGRSTLGSRVSPRISLGAATASTQHNPSDRLGAVRFFGLLDREHAEVIEFYAARQDAHRELAEILRDEPDWAGQFEIMIVDFSGLEPTVTSTR